MRERIYVPKPIQIARRPAIVARSLLTSSAPSRAGTVRERLGNGGSQAVVSRSISAHTTGAVQRSESAAAPASQRFANVSLPHDRAEVEASEVARKVMRASAPTGAAAQLTAVHDAPVQRAVTAASPPAPASVPAPVSVPTSGGSPLPPDVRQFMEHRFGASFEAVRIHSDEAAAQQSAAIDAHAFTVGKHIFFGRDQFRPDSAAGQELIAHELAHTIQQGQVVQRGADVAVAQKSPPAVQRVGGIRDWLADQANAIPGFRMFTIVLGVNPINMSPVDRSAANVLRAVVEFIPGGRLISQALEAHGVFERAGAWIVQKISALGLAAGSIRQALDQFISGLSVWDLRPTNWGSLWESAKRIFTAPIDRITSFVAGLATEIIQFIREAILLPLAALAEGTRGYDLLKAVLGQDPITGMPAARSPENLIGGFMKLIGEEEVWQNIQKANAIPRCWAWFQGALQGLMGFVKQIPTRLIAAIKSLDVSDMILVPKAFAKIALAFASFVGEFLKWAGEATWHLLEIIFEVVAPRAIPYLKKAVGAFRSILKNPIGFVGNLVSAAKLGFTNFADRIGTHLKAGLIDWLTGSLEGVYIPKALSLLELGKFALSVLEITWAQIRGKIIKVLGSSGEKIMQGLEVGFDIVVALVKGGAAAAWELIKEKLSDLKDTVVGGIISFVTDTIVKKAVPKLISMFIPGAGFISAIISIYDTIMVFVEKISKIIQVVTAFIDSIITIAAGNITAAANRVESILGGLLSLTISFLAGFLGLGKVTDKIKEVIHKVRGTVDKAIDAAIMWVVAKAKALFGKLFRKDADKEDPEEQKKVDAGLAAIEQKVKAFQKDGQIERTDAEKVAADVRKEYPVFKAITVVDGGDTWDYDYVASPGKRKKGAKKQSGGAMSDSKRAKALQKLKAITSASQVSPALEQLSTLEPKVLDRYKGAADGYELYLKGIKNGEQFDWPLEYLKRRAAFKKGKAIEAEWIKKTLGLSPNPQAFEVLHGKSWDSVIPDILSAAYVGDCKDWADISWRPQLRDFYTIARARENAGMVRYAGGAQVLWTKTFILLVRHKSHSEGETVVSGPLKAVADVRYVITDKDVKN
jgi:hypothetical protein